jgi:hypothetical protein
MLRPPQSSSRNCDCYCVHLGSIFLRSRDTRSTSLLDYSAFLVSASGTMPQTHKAPSALC